MNIEAFLEAYNESRNGANEFYKYPVVPKFHYSDGVRDCARAGCYWLLDIAATELPAKMHKHGETRAILEVRVAKNGACHMTLTVDDDKPAIWSKHAPYTDMPEGAWFFELGDAGGGVVAMILLTEH